MAMMMTLALENEQNDDDGDLSIKNENGDWTY